MYRLIALLVLVGICGPLQAGEPVPDVRATISKGLEYLTDKGIDWKEDRKCSSCHHTPFTLWSLNEAKRAGYQIEDKVVADLTTWVLAADDPGKVFPKAPEPPAKPEPPKAATGAEPPKETKDPEQPKETKQPEQPNQPDISVNVSPLLFFFGVASGDISAETTRQAMKRMLTTVIEKQQPDGAWKLSSLAEPINSTPDVLTGLTLLALTAPNAPDLGDVGKSAKDKGLAWFAANPGDSLQGTVIRLLVWRRLDRPETDWQPIVKDILGKQNADGGWSQTKDLPSDAYATGQVLYALTQSGLAADDPAVVKAQAFLIKNQDENGSWPMASRPKQRDGKSSKNLEPISYAATAWAVVALATTNPVKAP